MNNNEYSVAEAKKHFSELLSRVAYGNERITIAKRGKPLAILVPPHAEQSPDHLSQVEGWLENSDPFFKIVDRIVKKREKHIPRVAKSQYSYRISLHVQYLHYGS